MPWWIFIICCFISMIGFGLLVNTIGNFFMPISKEFGVGRASVSLMTTLQNAFAAVALIFSGKIMEKINLRWLLTSIFVIITICLLSLTQAHSLIHFYIAWTIIGLCQPIAITLSIPVLLSKWFNQKLGTVMGISLGLSALGGTIFNPIIAGIINNQGWRNGFFVEALIFGVILIPLALTIKSQPDENHLAFGKKTENEKKTIVTGFSVSQAIHMPVFYALIFAMFALQFVSGSVQHISGHVTNIGFSPIIAASVVSGVMIGAAVGKISIGYFLDKFNSKIVLTIFTILGILGWSCLATIQNENILIGSGFILGLGQGICLVALPYLIKQEFGEKDYSNILSIINMFGAVAMSISVYLVGLIFDRTGSYNIGWYINVSAYILSLIFMLLTIKNQQSYK